MGRLRLALAAAAAAAAVALAGCGENEGITGGGAVIGETLTVTSLLPHPDAGYARDVVDGQRLELDRAGGRAGRFKVNFASIDETGDATGDELAGAVADATRQAIADAQVIAVVGDLDAATARTSVPLLDSAGILHVSPGVSYPGFVRGVEPGEPDRWYPSGRRSFFPLAPDDEVQARALAAAIDGRVVVEQEESPSGRAFGAALRKALGSGRLVGDARQADAAVYAGTDPAAADGVVADLLRENPRLAVHLPSALAGSRAAARPRVWVLSGWPVPDAAYARAFEAAFGRAPGPGALAGRDAMAAVLAAIARAGDGADSRRRVIDAFAATARPATRVYLVRSRGRPESRPIG